MTVDALIPCVFVRPAVNREIHVIVVKVCRLPGRFIVAILAGGWKSRRCMVRIICLIVFCLVTAVAGIRRIVVIAVDVAGTAIERGMRTI